MKTNSLPQLDWDRINSLIDFALFEDIKEEGDATSLSVIPGDVITEASFVTREKCAVAGIDIAKAVFKKLDEGIIFEAIVKDGDILEVGDTLAKVKGNAQKILTAERTALNFLQRLCGIATAAYNYSSILTADSKLRF